MRRRLFTHFLAAAVALAPLTNGNLRAADDKDSSSLPLKRIVLFNSGVGFFEHGGEVTGVIPHGLKIREVAHDGVLDMRIVDSMHERKALMNELSDAFISLPGGLGTIEETAEMLTWAQLGIHRKPVALLNVLGFYDPLIAFLDRTVEEGFLRAANRQLLVVGTSAPEMLDRLSDYRAPETERWITRSET